MMGSRLAPGGYHWEERQGVPPTSLRGAQDNTDETEEAYLHR